MARKAPSLRTLVIALVLGGAVLPLGAVGAWLAQSAVRSGEALLTSELNLMLDRIADGVETRWASRRGNLLLLAHNAEVASALAGPASSARDDSVGAYLQELYAQMRSQLPMVVIRDVNRTERWQMADSIPDMGRGDKDGEPMIRADPPFIVRETITENGRRVGELEAHVRFSSLVSADTASQRVSGAMISIVSPDGAVLYEPSTPARDANGPTLAVRRELVEPAVHLTVSAPLEPYVQPFRRASLVGTIALLLVAAVSLALTSVLARRLTHPLSALAGAADAVAGGDLDRRVALLGPDESRRVAAAFNSMTVNLRATLDSAARQRSLAAVGAFAASLAHEVRNALTAVRVDVQRARKKTSDRDVTDLLDRTLSHVLHLDRVVSGALSVSRTGTVQIEPMDVGAVLLEAERTVATELAHAKVMVVYASPPGTRSVVVPGDAVALRQLFINLLLNATEASQPGASITVRVYPVDQQIVVKVTDSGTGIDNAHLDRIWEPLYTTKINGTGLGLPIARQIAVAHGGSLSLSSRLGIGTTVELRLPTFGKGRPIEAGA